MYNWRIRPYRLLIQFICIYLLTTLSYRLWPVASPNRLIGYCISACLILIVASKKIRKNTISILLGGILIVILGFVYTEDVNRHITDAVYWIVTIIVFLMLGDFRDIRKLITELQSLNKWIKIIVCATNILIIISLLDSRCYSTSWGGSYFYGYAPAEHTLCSAVCLLFSLTLHTFEGKKIKMWQLIWFLPGASAIMASGARTFMIPLVLFLILVYVIYIKNISLKIVLLPVGVVVAVYAFFSSGMYEKFLFVLGNQNISDNALSQVTSGRIEFWAIDLWKFASLNLMQKLIGGGFDLPYLTNARYYGMKIWSHNDIINLLLSTGILGTGIYIMAIFKVIKTLKKVLQRRIIVILLAAYLVFPMLLNGLFGYQHYVYGFLILVLAIYKKELIEKGVREFG